MAGGFLLALFGIFFQDDRTNYVKMLSVIVTNPLTRTQQPTAIALGNFDGIHQGHLVVLQPVLTNAPNNLVKAVVSFSPHPRQFFSQQTLTLLTPKAEKADLLGELGFQELILIPFDRSLALLSPEDFVQEVLVKQLQAKFISIGADFHFGHQRKGTATDLVAIASKQEIEVRVNSLYEHETNQNEPARVSSSLIRQTLLAGDVEQANMMLGRAYCLQGKVVEGKQIGRTIGFPTANLAVPELKFLPRYGVYAVRVDYQNETILGVMNIGCRPTVAGEAPTIEVHLLNWSGDLYGCDLTVHLEKFLRPEQKFDSLDSLKKQIHQDCQRAKELMVLS